MENENNSTAVATEENIPQIGIKIIQEGLIKKNNDSPMLGEMVYGKFWAINPLGDVEIVHSWLLDHIHEDGFFNMEQGNKITLVWEVSPNVIIPGNIKIIKDRVRNFIESSVPPEIGNNATRDHLLQKLTKGLLNYINHPKLEFLPIRKVNFLKDSSSTSYFFFKNVAIKVTADKIEPVDYSALPAKVWGAKIRERSFNPSMDFAKGSVIERFFRKITGEDEKWFESLQTHIGYLLHRYTPGHLSVLIAFLDRHIKNFWEANGGTGKSMIMRSIMQLRDVARVDGKKDISYNFAFDNVDAWTDIVYIEDLKKEISIERFFVAITEATSVNRKYKDQLILSDEDRPKYAVSSNYVLRMPVGAAAERRIREMEIDNYYNEKLSAYDEFGHEFFRQWTDDEFQRFFHFMLSCIQVYLSKSIIPAPNINREYRRLLSHTGDDFIEFMDDLLSEKAGKVKIRKDEIRDLYRKINPSQKYQHSSKNKFTSMMKKYFEYKQIAFEETPKNSKKYFEISLPDDGKRGLETKGITQNVPVIDGGVLTASQAERMFDALDNQEFKLTVDTNE